MASTPIQQSPAFTQHVVSAMRKLYPEELADRRWDNVGLLQENVDDGWSQDSRVVLLTNDLTVQVAQEAIQKKASVIVAYHPFIFRGLKSLTLGDPHQQVILLLARHNIAAYSPHTAVDAADGGLNDWLADIATRSGAGVTKRSVAQPISGSIPPGYSGDQTLVGYGRVLELSQPTTLGSLVKAYAHGLGGLRHVMVAAPTGPGMLIKSIAVCAGSGADVLAGCDADLFVTGEMSHHPALRLKMLGKAVLTVFHSNSERAFLRERMRPRLETLLRVIDGRAEVVVSEVDRDPFEIWDVSELDQRGTTVL